MKKELDDGAFFTVQAWMITKLHLKTVERDAFAIIYGFSQDGESDYHGSLSYMSALTGYSKQSLCNALKSLTEKQYILKEEFELCGVKVCRYKANLDLVKNLKGIQGTLMGIQGTLMGIQGTLTNNKVNNNIDNKEDDIIINNNKTDSDNTLNDSFSDSNIKNNNECECDPPAQPTKQEKEKKPKKSRYDKCLDIIDEFVEEHHFGQDIKKALISYLEMRLQMSQIYANQWKGLLNRLVELSTDHKIVIKIINQSILKGWASFYELKEYGNQQYNSAYQKNVVFSEQGVSSNTMTEEDFSKEKDFQEQLRKDGKKWKF